MPDRLWSLEGWDRLEAISKMKLSELDDVCRLSRHCFECPFAILYQDQNGYSRLLCVDVATGTRIANVLRYGGRFLRKGEKLSDEK